MPTKVSVGLSKKAGLPDFGSLGASCHIEIELDQPSTTEDSAAFHRKVREAFADCQRAVDEQLSHQSAGASGGVNGSRFNGSASNGSPSSGTGYPPQRSNGRAATEKQVKMLHAMAGRQRINLSQLLQDRFGVSRPADLSLRDASSLIDELKESEGAVR